MKSDRSDTTRPIEIPDGGAPKGSKPRSLTVAIVEAVAESTGRDPTALPPLYHAVDPEALEILTRQERVESPNKVRVTFRFDGIEVTVDRGGNIELRHDEERSE